MGYYNLQPKMFAKSNNLPSSILTPTSLDFEILIFRSKITTKHFRMPMTFISRSSSASQKTNISSANYNWNMKITKVTLKLLIIRSASQALYSILLRLHPLTLKGIEEFLDAIL